MEPGKKRGNNKSNKDREEEQVDQLLQAAQDELMLNLTVDSHMSRVAPDYLLSDLDRRFQALKSGSSSSVHTTASPSQSQSSSLSSTSSVPNITVNEELKSVLGDDLSVRFAALKASLPTQVQQGPPSIPNVGDENDDDYDEEDEVEKLIKWAKDAARLDPTPPSDIDDYEDDDD